MTDSILNPDGSTYMTFPPAVPSPRDLEGWTVRQVTTGTHGPACPSGKRSGTQGGVSVDVESFNGLLRLVNRRSAVYGCRPRSHRIAADTFRWTFEMVTPDGHRVTNMIIASKIA